MISEVRGLAVRGRFPGAPRGDLGRTGRGRRGDVAAWRRLTDPVVVEAEANPVLVLAARPRRGRGRRRRHGVRAYVMTARRASSGRSPIARCACASKTWRARSVGGPQRVRSTGSGCPSAGRPSRSSRPCWTGSSRARFEPHRRPSAARRADARRAGQRHRRPHARTGRHLLAGACSIRVPRSSPPPSRSPTSVTSRSASSCGRSSSATRWVAGCRPISARRTTGIGTPPGRQARLRPPPRWPTSMTSTPATLTHALSLAATMAGGLQQTFRSDAAGKPLHAGSAAQAGVVAVAAARGGVTGAADVLEGPAGLGGGDRHDDRLGGESGGRPTARWSSSG